MTGNSDIVLFDLLKKTCFQYHMLAHFIGIIFVLID